MTFFVEVIPNLPIYRFVWRRKSREWNKKSKKEKEAHKMINAFLQFTTQQTKCWREWSEALSDSHPSRMKKEKMKSSKTNKMNNEDWQSLLHELRCNVWIEDGVRAWKKLITIIITIKPHVPVRLEKNLLFISQFSFSVFDSLLLYFYFSSIPHFTFFLFQHSLLICHMNRR